jgi:hypothetical protein
MVSFYAADQEYLVRINTLVRITLDQARAKVPGLRLILNPPGSVISMLLPGLGRE